MEVHVVLWFSRRGAKVEAVEFDESFGGKLLLLWLVVGDFNEIVNDTEKLGKNLQNADKMRDSRECLEGCELDDFGFVGHSFTWTNKRAGDDNIRRGWIGVLQMSFGVPKSQGQPLLFLLICY